MTMITFTDPKWQHGFIFFDISIVPSVLPPSMMINSKSSYPCNRTDLMASSINWAWLRDGITILMRGNDNLALVSPWFGDSSVHGQPDRPGKGNGRSLRWDISCAIRSYTVDFLKKPQSVTLNEVKSFIIFLWPFFIRHICSCISVPTSSSRQFIIPTQLLPRLGRIAIDYIYVGMPVKLFINYSMVDPVQSDMWKSEFSKFLDAVRLIVAMTYSPGSSCWSMLHMLLMYSGAYPQSLLISMFPRMSSLRSRADSCRCR